MSKKSLTKADSNIYIRDAAVFKSQEEFKRAAWLHKYIYKKKSDRGRVVVRKKFTGADHLTFKSNPPFLTQARSFVY